MNKKLMERGKSTRAILLITLIVIASVASVVIYMTTRPKAQFETKNLEIEKPPQSTNQLTKIFCTLSNSGDKSGTFNAELQLDGKIVENRSIKLAEKENTEIVFPVKIDESGDHAVKIGELSENFKLESPEFQVTDLNISSKKVKPREELFINVGVKNSGDLSGKYNAKLNINESVEKEKTVELLGKERKTVPFRIKKEEKKKYSVNIGGLSKSFEVLAPAEFKVTSLSVSPSRVKSGEPVSVDTSIKNVGYFSDNHLVKLEVSGAVEDQKTINLEGNQSTDLDFIFSKQEEGTYKVQVGEAIGTFEVYNPPSTPACTTCG